MLATEIDVARSQVQPPQAQNTVRGERPHAERLGQVVGFSKGRVDRRNVRMLALAGDGGEEPLDVRELAPFPALAGDRKGPPGMLESQVAPAGEEMGLAEP